MSSTHEINITSKYYLTLKNNRFDPHTNHYHTFQIIRYACTLSDLHLYVPIVQYYYHNYYYNQGRSAWIISKIVLFPRSHQVLNLEK